MHHHQGRLPPPGNQGQGHDRFTAAGGRAQGPEVPARHRLHRVNLEVPELAKEGESQPLVRVRRRSSMRYWTPPPRRIPTS